MHTLTLRPLAAWDRVILVGALAAFAVGGCNSPTSPTAPTDCSASTAQSAGSGALWVGSVSLPALSPQFQTKVQGYAADQLASSSSAAPAATLTLGASSQEPGYLELAFDPSGNLWVAYFDAVVEYTACQLMARGSPKPNVTLTANAAGSLDNPVALAFDARGDLWVANALGGPGSNTIVEFTPGQLAASGSPTPAVTLSAGNNSLGSIAFDHNGNLWTSISYGDAYASGAVVEFAARQLVTSGSPTPAVTLNVPAGLIAFDGGGNLWAAIGVNYTIVEFASGQLGSTGTPTPAVVLTDTALNRSGLAFDRHGNLWVANSLIDCGAFCFASNVVEFTASQLTGSGASTPAVTISSAGGLGLAIAP